MLLVNSQYFGIHAAQPQSIRPTGMKFSSTRIFLREVSPWVKQMRYGFLRMGAAIARICGSALEGRGNRAGSGTQPTIRRIPTNSACDTKALQGSAHESAVRT